MAIAGGHIAVGAPGHVVAGGVGGVSGTVYLFANHAHDWREQSQLTGNPLTPNFEGSVALDGKALVVGSPGFYVGEIDLDVPGNAFVFPTR